MYIKKNPTEKSKKQIWLVSTIYQNSVMQQKSRTMTKFATGDFTNCYKYYILFGWRKENVVLELAELMIDEEF